MLIAALSLLLSCSELAAQNCLRTSPWRCFFVLIGAWNFWNLGVYDLFYISERVLIKAWVKASNWASMSSLCSWKDSLRRYIETCRFAGESPSSSKRPLNIQSLVFSMLIRRQKLAVVFHRWLSASFSTVLIRMIFCHLSVLALGFRRREAYRFITFRHFRELLNSVFLNAFTCE